MKPFKNLRTYVLFCFLWKSLIETVTAHKPFSEHPSQLCQTPPPEIPAEDQTRGGSFTWSMQPVIATQRSAFGHLKPVHGLSNGRKISWDKLLRACSEAMQGEPCSRKHRRFPLGRWYRSTAWAGASSVQSWRLTWPFLKWEYSFWNYC